MNVPVGHVAERDIQLTLGAMCYSLAVNLDLEGFTLVLMCRTVSYGTGSSVGGQDIPPQLQGLQLHPATLQPITSECRYLQRDGL